jgi:hypothetical protein
LLRCVRDAGRWSFWERALWDDAAVASGLEAADAFLQFGLTAVTLNRERGVIRLVRASSDRLVRRTARYAFGAWEIYA